MNMEGRLKMQEFRKDWWGKNSIFGGRRGTEAPTLGTSSGRERDEGLSQRRLRRIDGGSMVAAQARRKQWVLRHDRRRRGMEGQDPGSLERESSADN